MNAKTTPMTKGHKYLWAASQAKYTKCRPVSRLQKLTSSSPIETILPLNSSQDAVASNEKGGGRNKWSCEVRSPVDQPADWCAPMVVVLKPSKNVRLWVDLTKLKEGFCRELYVMKKVEEFSKLDTNFGSHQVVLMDASVKLTMFITLFWRFMFRRLPYGISSAPEYFQKRMDKEVTGLQGVMCHMHDIKEEHKKRLVKVIQHLKGFKVMHLNIRSLVSKYEQLKYELESCNVDIFSISETWLTEGVCSW